LLVFYEIISAPVLFILEGALLHLYRKLLMDEEGVQASPVSEGDCAVWKARATFYRAIIERYRDYLFEGEQKTVPLLKSMIDPKDPAVQKLHEQIISSIKQTKSSAAGDAIIESKALEYNYETDFDEAARAAFDYVQSLGKTHSELSVSFWLSYPQMVSLGIADAFDRALLLCSLLSSLGCKSALVSVLSLEDGSTHPVVIFESAGRDVLLDACNKSQKFGDDAGQSKAELVAGFSTGDGKKAVRIAYEFNRDEYAEFEADSS